MTPDKKTDIAELTEAMYQIQEIATGFGLDPFDTHFQLVPAEIIYEYGAYGIPGRFSHWTHGKDYHQMKMVYDYGLYKIYELVINNDPAQAFLLANNEPIQNKLVMAHVLGHTDFFKRNIAFKATNRQMIQQAHIHADRIRGYEFEYGEEVVEGFIDKVLSLSQHVGMWGKDIVLDETSVARKRKKEVKKGQYDDLLTLGEKIDPQTEEEVPFPEHEEYDLLGFLATRSPNRRLQEWHKDIILMIRSEMKYFAPQLATKIMNEGWAALWHTRILREMDERNLLTFAEGLEWNSLNAGVIAPNRQNINPYYVGYHIFNDADKRFHGEVDKDLKEKDWLGRELDAKRYMGRQDHDIFWIRENIGGDHAFVGEYLTDQLIADLDLYTYHLEGDSWVISEKDPSEVRNNLVRNLSNHGVPEIAVEIGGGDYKGNNELYLKHKWDEQDLDEKEAKDVLKNLHYIWGRPVHLETKVGDKGVLYTCSDPNTVGSSFIT